MAAVFVPSAGAFRQTSDDALLRIAKTRVSALGQAGQVAAAGNPDAVQAQYDTARNLEEDLRALEPVSKRCRGLRSAANALARAHVNQAEGFDRQEPARTSIGRRQATNASARIPNEVASCDAAGSNPPPTDTGLDIPLLSPTSDEVAYGAVHVRAVAPPGAIWATIHVDGSAGCNTDGVERVAVGAARTVDARLTLVPGRYDLTATYCGQGSRPRVFRTDVATDVWVLPRSARHVNSPRPSSPAISRRLRSVAATFTGYSGVWHHDLRTGETATWNATARFPAASTVKLAVLVAALRTLGPDPGLGTIRARPPNDDGLVVEPRDEPASRAARRRIGRQGLAHSRSRAPSAWREIKHVHRRVPSRNERGDSQ